MKNSTQKTLAARGAANTAGPARRVRNFTPQSKTPAVARSAAALDMEVAHEICSLANPFCPQSRGSKWPDESSGQSLAIPVRQRFTISTDASGEALWVFAPIYPAGVLHGTSSGGYFTWASTSNYLPTNSVFTDYRIVSGGIQVTSILSAMNSQGVVNVVEVPPFDLMGDVGAGWDFTIKSFPTYETLPLRSVDSLFGTFRSGGTEARNFHPVVAAPPALVTDPFSTNDWSSMAVYVSGGPASTPCIIVDVYINLEIHVELTSSYAYLTTPARVPRPLITRAVNALLRGTAVRGGTEESNDRGWISDALGYLKSGGKFAFDNAGTIFGMAQAGASLYAGNPAGAAGALALTGAGRYSQDRKSVV